MSAPRRDPASWGDLRTELHRQGATLLRTRGSHEVWRTRDGKRFVVVRNHLSAAVPVGIRVRFRQLHSHGTGEADEPLLFARGRGLVASPSRERKEPDRVKELWKRQSSRKCWQQGRLERQLRPRGQRKLWEERQQQRRLS